MWIVTVGMIDFDDRHQSIFWSHNMAKTLLITGYDPVKAWNDYRGGYKPLHEFLIQDYPRAYIHWMTIKKITGEK